MTQRAALIGVLAGGTIAGALDIVFALTFAASRGVGPLRVLQSVASGALGEAAFSGGLRTAILGLALHFCIACIWAALFFACASRIRALTDRPLISGMSFGVAVFLAMRLVVLPLSAFPYPMSFAPLATTLDLLSHMFLFGVPIAMAARRALQTQALTRLAKP
jgi:uncharacterized membrane protein YagU involved in acid resistance